MGGMPKCGVVDLTQPVDTSSMEIPENLKIVFLASTTWKQPTWTRNKENCSKLYMIPLRMLDTPLKRYRVQMWAAISQTSQQTLFRCR